MSTKPLLKYLDNPVRIMSVTIPDLMGYVAPFFIGLMLDSVLIIPTSGWIILYFIKKILKPLPKFYLMRRLYWSIPTSKFNKSVKVSWPSSSKRLWVK